MTVDVTGLACKRFRLEWDEGSRAAAVAIGREFLAANPSLLVEMRRLAREVSGLRPEQDLQVDHIVRLVDEYRARGEAQRDSVTICDMALNTGLWSAPDEVGAVDVEVPEPPASEVIELEWMAGEWSKGAQESRELAQSIARDFVQEHRRKLAAAFEGLTREQCVRLLEQEREAGRETRSLVVQAWLWSEYEPVRVSGRMATGITHRAIQQAVDRKRALR